jgi:hypothetical protein
MRIEILYVPDCPNYQPAVEQVERVLCSESLQAEIRSIAVRTDAELAAVAKRVQLIIRTRPMLPDPKDEMVLETAVIITVLPMRS